MECLLVALDPMLAGPFVDVLTAVTRASGALWHYIVMNDLGMAAPALTHRCDPSEIPFATTDDVRADGAVVGQARAESALAFALGVRHEDCNVFVMGPPAIGKRSLVKSALAQRAASTPVPPDWVYVNNFAAPHEPTAIELPAGRGSALRRDMEQLIDDLRRVIPSIFDSEEYAQRAERIQAEFNERRDKAVAEVGAEAQAQGINLMRTPAGYVFLPAKGGEVIPAEDYQGLPQEERDRFSAAITALQERLEKVIRDTLRARKESSERLAQLNREMVMLAIEQPVEELARRYAEWPKVVEYLHAVQRDALENADSFQREAEPDGGIMAQPGGDLRLRRYRVNVLADRASAAGAEVIFCDHPTYANLVGHSDNIQHFGTLVTDFTLLKPGALHRANGGYLVVDALQLLQQPFAWEALKRALTRREIRIEPVAELSGVVPAAALQPEPIPLRVRVVLLGERRLYYLLQAFDPDFPRLFKVVADFDDELDRGPQSVAAYARLVAGLAQRDALLPFDRAAVARLVDEASRHAADSRKLSADRGMLVRLMREADFAAHQAASACVGAAHVEQAVDAHRLRSSRLRLRVQEAIERGIVMIDTSGERIGQVNALAMIDVGEVPFGMPARVSATTRPGEGAVIDIQREARLGGAVH
ncbi:MAG TPA: ATP-binding protein, partial [Usitatibacter sp.]|nr:ATP-binding protein [Usitatibacter sp.]